MSKDISKTKVGFFVIGSLALFILAIISLGGKDIFAEDIEYVLYFDGSVSGLSIGAPVVFRGVPMGKVTQILLVANSRDEGVTIPVYITINASSIAFTNSTQEQQSQITREELMRRMIQRGLRARLQMQSLITGQYNVELDFFPDTPARYHSANHAFEIPTVPSPLDQFQRTLARLPLENMAQSLNDALDGFARLTNNTDLHASLKAMRETFENTSELTANATSLRNDIQRAINALGDTSATLDNQLPEAMTAFQLAMNGFAAAAHELETVLISTNQIISPNSRIVRDLDKTLSDVSQTAKEISKTARAFKELADLLEQHPESLILGKGGR